MKKLPLSLFALACAASVFALEIEVPAGTTNSYTTALGSDVAELVKTGAGRLHLALGAGTTSAFAGPVTVKDGVLGMDSPSNLGKPTSITVDKGATLDASAVSGSAVYGVTGGSITLAGSGFEGQGALRRTSGGAQDALFKGFVLADDAMVYNSSRCGFMGGTLDFNGHVFEKTGGGELLFHGCTWKAPGGIVVNGGKLTLQGTDSQYGGGAANTLVGKGGTLTLWGSPGYGRGPKWTLAVSNNFFLTTGSTAANVNAWDGPLEIPGGKALTVNPWSNPSEFCFGGPVNNQGTITKQGGNGTLYFRGSPTTNYYISVEGGHVRYEGDGTGRHEIGQVTTANAHGSLTLANAGYVHHYRGNFWVAGNGNNLNTVTITNTVLDGWISSTHASIISLGDAAGYNGRLIVDAGSSVSNRLTLGNSGRGAVYQRGGDVYWQVQNGGSYEFFGGRGYGYYGLDAGTLYADKWLGLAPWSTSARAFFVQRGGSARFHSLTVGSKGRAEVYVGGGTATCGVITLGSDGDYDAASGSATLTVDNGGFLDLGRAQLFMQHTNGFLSVVNLNRGGRLRTSRMNTKGRGASQGSEAYYNFDGGVLSPSQAWGFTDAWSASTYDPTRATILDGGLTVDASGCATDKAYSRIPFALQRPYGRGVKSIALPPADSAFWSKNFLGPTRVVISGAGKAATALVDFDHAAKKPRGVIVTGAGFGYDEETTATVESWDGTTTYPCTVETFEHSCTGGFTLVNAPGVTLIATNTWGGPTTVKSGTLQFETVQSYPAQSPLVMRPAGTVDFYNINRTLPSISGAGAVTKADITVTNGVSFFAADANTNAYLSLTGKLTFGANTKLTVLDPANLDYHMKPRLLVARAAGGVVGAPTFAGTDDPRWRAVVSGNSVYAYFPVATAVILR